MLLNLLQWKENAQKKRHPSFTKPAKERTTPKQRLPLTEKTNTVNTNTVNTGEILSKESDYDEGEDGSLPSENEETVSFLNEDVLQQRKDTLEAELQNTQEYLKQLLADG